MEKTFNVNIFLFSYKNVKKILKEIKLENIKLEKTIRITSKDKDKPSHLILVLKDKAERNNLLSMAKNLKKSCDF